MSKSCVYQPSSLFMSTPMPKVRLLTVQISHLEMAQQDRFQIATPEVAMDGSPVTGDVKLASLIERINMLDDAHLAEIETHVAEIERNIQELHALPNTPNESPETIYMTI